MQCQVVGDERRYTVMKGGGERGASHSLTWRFPSSQRHEQPHTLVAVLVHEYAGRTNFIHAKL
jgi:hypothetical protein